MSTSGGAPFPSSNSPPPAVDPTESGSGGVADDDEVDRMTSGDVANMIFSTKRPKHLGAGIASGVKNVARGVAAGAALFGVACYAGAREQGVKGALKGAAGGLAAFVGLTVAGTAIAVKQIAHGAISTPEAVSNVVSNQQCWDTESRSWRVFDDVAFGQDSTPPTDDDIFTAARVRHTRLRTQQARDDGTATGAAPAAPQQTHYDTLGVAPTATPSEIKKAYMTKALKCHPDKAAPENRAEAEQQFKAVSGAYQVLSNASRRAEYDARGMRDEEPEGAGSSSGVRGAADLSQMHPMELLVGGEEFLPFIGRRVDLIAMAASSEFAFTKNEKTLLTRRNYARCSAYLARLLDRIVESREAHGASAPLPVDIEGLLERLHEASLGPQLLFLLARRYEISADNYCGRDEHNPVRFAKASAQDTVESGRRVVHIAATVRNAFRMQQNPDAAAQDNSALLLFGVAEGQIADFVHRVAQRVLYDEKAPPTQRHRRANALYALSDAIDAVVKRHEAAAQPKLIASRSGSDPAPAAS